MIDDVVQEVKAHVERVVSAKMANLEERLSGLLSGCATETCVKEETNTLKALLARVETRFREEHAGLVDAINEQKAMTKAQTALLEALCSEVETANEKIDTLCSHTGPLWEIEGDVAAISKSVQGVANGTDTVSSFVSCLSKHLDDIRLVVGHKTSENRKAEEEKRLSFFWRELEIIHDRQCQRTQEVDGEGKCNNRLRQHG